MAESYAAYESVEVSVAGGVATLAMHPFRDKRSDEPARGGSLSWDLGRIFGQMRDDKSIRVIILTGKGDDEFLASGWSEGYAVPEDVASVTNPRHTHHMMGLVRTHLSMAEIEKPIIARVNGDAIGLGQSLMFSSDLIVARADAVISDVHLGQGTVFRSDGRGPVGPAFGLVAGDGAGALAPMLMPHALAKEYLLLSRSWTAAKLADINCINYAVSAETLDDVVGSLTEELLSKSAYALGWTKRVSNRHLIEHLHNTLDLAMAYEHITIMQAEQIGFANINTFE